MTLFFRPQPKAHGPMPKAILCVFCIIVAFSVPCGALVSTGGSEPARDAGWPVGCLEMANLPTRFACYGSGECSTFQYRSNGTAPFNEALQTFAKILWPRLEVIVVDGLGSVLGKPDEAVDWEFRVWVPEFYFKYRRSGISSHEPSIPPPRITAYVGKGSMIEWPKVVVPPNVTVIDKRVETSPYKDSKGGVVRVTAYSMTTGKVIPEADIVLTKYEEKKYVEKYAGRTGDAGSIVIRDIAPGYYYLTLRCAGYATRTVKPAYRNWERTLGLYDVLLSPAASLSGTVTDLAGAPLADVGVRSMDAAGLDDEAYSAEPIDASQKTTTGADGQFHFDDLPRGVTRLSAGKDGYSQMVSVMTEYEVPGKAPVVIRMDRSAAVRGKVAGAAKLEPDQKIHVSIEPEEGPTIGKWSGSTNCQPDGSFEFKGIPPGRYSLILGRFTKNETKQPIELKPGQTLEVELKIE